LEEHLADISELEQPSDELRALRQKAETGDKLWASIGEDSSNEIDRIAQDNRVARSLVVELLTYETMQESKAEGRAWLTRYWLEIALVLGLISLIVLTLYTMGILTPVVSGLVR